jgi:hypothetical protein
MRCAVCQRKAMRAQKRLTRLDPVKEKARKAAYYAMRSGKIKVPDECEMCGSPAEFQLHHEDYAKPLEVVRICEGCHRLMHTVIRQQSLPITGACG